MSELGDKLEDVQTCMLSVSVKSKKKSLIPKDLCVSYIYYVMVHSVYDTILISVICEEPSCEAWAR